MYFLLIIKCFFALSLFNPQELETKPQPTQEKALLKIEELCQLSKKYRDFEPKKSISYGNQAIQLATQTGNKKSLALAYNATGSGYYILGDFDQALNLYYKSLRLRVEIADSVGMSASYNNIANVHNNLEEYDKALSNYKKSLAISTNTKDDQAYSATLINIGNVYTSKKEYSQALDHYKRSLVLKEKLNDKEGVLANLVNMGISYSGKGNQELALRYFNKALPLAEELNSQHDKVYILRGRAEAYLLTKQYQPAIQNALESLEKAKKYEGKDEIRLSAEVLNTIYTQVGDYAKAHEYLSLYNVYNDSIKNEQVAEKMALAQVKYETAQKEKENLKLRSEHILHKKELEKTNLTQFFTIALLLIMSLLAIIFFKGRQRLHQVNNLLTQKNEQIMQSNLLLQQHQAAQTLQAEQLQSQKEELERLNTVKNKLFSVIAHDLRGPLVSLQGLLQIMSKGMVPVEKQAILFQSLVKGQQNILWMLDNLFDWAKAQMNGFEVHKERLDVRELTDEITRLLSPLATSKEISLENKIGDDSIAFADREMIRLVLRNLISNGIKFCNSGSKVTISVWKDKENGMLSIAVEDTGIGISSQAMQNLFVHSNYTTRGTSNEKGSGLGLALCREFVERNGGKLGVSSEVGKGSTFHFTLPEATTQANTMVPADSEQHKFQLA